MSSEFCALISSLLNKVSFSLAEFLVLHLPDIFDNYWDSAVLPSLSYQQKQRIEERSINSLTELDFAALLRVFDNNFYQISNALQLPGESRNYLKEMQTVRNRWAHLSNEGVLLEDIYRDLDTLLRFAQTISAKEEVLADIKTARNEVFNAQNETTHNKIETLETDSNGEFKPGQMVYLRSDPTVQGAVIEVLEGGQENRFNVFANNSMQTFYASQLSAVADKSTDIEFLSRDNFHAHLSALQLKYPGLANLYSLNAARVDFIPYQFRPVLRFIRSDRPRMLIADSVGVGKTIEAGLILRELQARRDIKSVLIICPKPLITERKWENEMKRFDERFTQLDGNQLRHCIKEADAEGEWPEKNQKIIIPFSLFDETMLYGEKRRGSKGLYDLDPPPRFDLVIVDEAHHIRNPTTYSHKAVSYFCENAEAVLFLTATPIQMGDNDLFVLLNALRPDLIIDEKSFQHMTEPNPHINRAVSAMRFPSEDWTANALQNLEAASSTSWGKAILKFNPDYKEITEKLKNAKITKDERVRMIRDTENLHTLANIINRTRRRDIDDFTIRKPETLMIPFTEEQQKLHDELLETQAKIFQTIHGNQNVKFFMSTIRRQAASCIFGLAPFLKDILNRHIDELYWADAGEEFSVSSGAFDLIQDQISELLFLAESLKGKDPKLEALIKIIRDKQTMANNKIMLFSSFRHTLNYLYKKLSAEGFRVGMLHGETPDEERLKLRQRFEKGVEEQDCLDLLLFSEIGCEGLDYQFCDCMVNYDLPWNPMRIEQRIGRIDRNGQKSETIAIINLITPGTVDAEIYMRCLLRIGVFERSIGGNEEILGQVSKELKNIAENYQLSENERNEKIQQLTDNKIRIVQEQEQLEEKQAELFGIRLPQEQINQEIAEANNFWLSPVRLQKMIELYLRILCGKDQEYILGEKALKTLRLSSENRIKLLKDFQELTRQNSSMYRDWENWLKGGEAYLPISFDQKLAMKNHKVAFIMPLHPLTRQAANFFKANKHFSTNLVVKSDTIKTGKYHFAIYQWRYHGIIQDLELKAISTSPELTEQLNKLLEEAEDSKENTQEKLCAEIKQKLEAEQHNLWQKALVKHKQKTNEQVEYRRESLTTSHNARIKLIEEQLRNSKNEKIRIMRQAQLNNAEADYKRRVQELNEALEKTDLVTKEITCGIIQVER